MFVPSSTALGIGRAPDHEGFGVLGRVLIGFDALPPMYTDSDGKDIKRDGNGAVSQSR